MRVASRASLGRRSRRRLASAATAVVLFALCTSLPVHADTASELAAAKKRLSALENEVESALAQKDSLQEQANALAKEISDVETQIALTQRKIELTEKALEKARTRLLYLQNRLNLRARDAYIKGPGGIFEVVLGSSSFADMQQRLALYDAVQQNDADLANQVEEQRVKLALKKADLHALEEDLVSQRAALVDRQQALTEKLTALNNVISSLDEKKREAQALVKELTARKAREEAAAAARLAGSIGGGGGPASGGVFQYCPVRGGVGYSDDFGAPRYGGGYHPHAGNDMFAAYGTPVVAPFSGYAYNSANGLGGNAVIVRGGAGYVYNAHLSSYGTLGNVSAGTVVGYVGNTGDAQGTPYHDHFEWHPYSIPSNPYRSAYGYTVIGSAIDPYPYLNSVC